VLLLSVAAVAPAKCHLLPAAAAVGLSPAAAASATAAAVLFSARNRASASANLCLCLCPFFRLHFSIVVLRAFTAVSRLVVCAVVGSRETVTMGGFLSGCALAFSFVFVPFPVAVSCGLVDRNSDVMFYFRDVCVATLQEGCSV
jgi:hypothetical protein